MGAAELNILTLPKDALLSILYHLNPSDILCLDQALPSAATGARTATQDPCLWRYLYRLHIPTPRSPPQLHITPQGTLDWRNAFQHAIRRQQAILVRNQLNNDNSYDTKENKDKKKSQNNNNITIQVTGNIRRVIANTSNNAANITWDSHTAAARFDWTQRQQHQQIALHLTRRRRNPILPSTTSPPRNARSSSEL